MVFEYSSSAHRIRLGHRVVAIFVYIVVYQVILQQRYRLAGEAASGSRWLGRSRSGEPPMTLRRTLSRPSPPIGTVFGSARLQLQEPNASVRMPAGQVPYCLGSNSSPPLPGYSYPPGGGYTWSGGPSAPQGLCQYQDAILAIPDVFLPGGAFVPTRLSLTPQAVGPLPACEQLASPTCEWGAKPGLPYATPQLVYVADPGEAAVRAVACFSPT